MLRTAMILATLLSAPFSFAEEAGNMREPASIETEEPIVIDMGDRSPDSVPAGDKMEKESAE